MYILPTLLLCPAAGAKQMLLWQRGAGAAAGRAGWQPGGAGLWAGPGYAPGSPYPGESS